MTVFDASAVLAILFDEPGAAKAAAYLPDSSISIANVAEAYDDFVRRGRTLADAASALSDLNLTMVSPDEDQAQRAAALRPIKGLSLGDRFCIALAQATHAPVVTADRMWATAPIGVSVELIR
jgi:ribonuclease VapC